MTHRERIFNIKLQTGFLPTANRMHMFDENTSSRCPCCGHLHENITHMLYCNNKSVQDHRTCEIEKLEHWMESNHTHPDIVRVIIDTLLTDSHVKFADQIPLDAHDSLRQCVQLQDSLDRLEFHRGHIVSAWGHIQKEHFDSMFVSSRKKQTRWTEGLIHKINSMNMSLWHFRNAIAEEQKKQEEKHRRTFNLDNEIEDIFRIGVAGIRPTDQHIILDTNIEKVLELSMSDKEDWISMVRTMQKCYARTVETDMYNMRLRFEQWTNFQRTSRQIDTSTTTDT